MHLTTPALQLCLTQGLELALFTRRGRLLGQLTPPFTKNIDLRRAQYARAGDPAFALEQARNIVAGKLANSLEMLRDFAHNHPEPSLADEISRLAAYPPQLAAAPDLNTLLGLEGSGARTYFAAFAKMVRRTFGFTGRARHPSPDPVNALLSLGYTMVYNEISSLLDGLGFDPYLGFYHQPRYGHATLASDLLEEFRAPLVDRFTLTLINNRVFQEGDFYQHTGGGVYLQDEPRKRYFQEYERFLTRPWHCPEEKVETDFRRHFRRQAERLAQAVTGGSVYQPYKFSW